MKRKHSFNFICGCALLLLTVLLIAGGLFLSPYGPEDMDAASKNLGPSCKHLFGTDHYGRDIYTRVAHGSLTTMLIGAMTIVIGGIIGTLVGALTGYIGGVFDAVVMRVNDCLLAFPSILLALVFVGVFGPSERNVVIALGILFVPSIARVVRSDVRTQLQSDYVVNAKLLGASNARILFVHILPNLRATLLVTMAVGFNNAVLAESGMSYLGLGVQPPKASLGRMLSEGQSYLRSAPWTVLFPGLVLVLAVLGVSLLSDAYSGNQGDTGSPSRIRARVTKKLAAAGYDGVVDEEKTESEDGDVVLSVRNLSVGFERADGSLQPVVRKISFSVHAGERLGIVGESGSGKSMTALSVMGLLPDTAGVTGEILLHTEAGTVNVRGCTKKELAVLRGDSMAMVFQEPMTSLNPTMPIGRQMLEMLTHNDVHLTKEEQEKRLTEALLEVELTETERILRSRPKELSGGQRQRVMIAIAMLLRPRLLILDEPTTALDAETRDGILKLLSELQKRHGMAVLFISHELAVVRRICSRVMVMDNGQIVESGTVGEIFENPQAEETKQLLQSLAGTDFRGEMHYDPEGRVILSVQHLHVYYGRRRGRNPLNYENKVLENFAMELREGEVLGIIGRSGSGKSTLARCLAGLIPKQAGRIETDAKIGMVFQDPYGSLNRAKTVEWLLEEPIRNRQRKQRRAALKELWSNRSLTKAERKSRRRELIAQYQNADEERRAEAKEMLAAVGLSGEYAERKITELSGGQRQRVAIGMAILGKPDILILDEPVSALDATVQEQVLALLAEFHDRFGLTYLFITHDEAVMNRMAHRVIYLNRE
ncbi:MAG: ATP-binding cassette domain-containing protein [Lachnospiraceae bacterium]|nr:ATP-binding cassette domain-containing protein [Lachnospiraceae bacterium]